MLVYKRSDTIQPQQPVKGIDTHTYNPRLASIFKLKIHHVAITERTPNCAGRKMYNPLPGHIQLSAKPFKKTAGKDLMYTITEFYNAFFDL